MEFANFLGMNGIPMTIVFTKTDKEKQRIISSNVNDFKARLLHDWESLPNMVMTSSLTGVGRDTLLELIENINKSL